MLYAGVCLFTLGRHGNGTQFCVLEHNIKHLWVIMWHIFTSTNNTTTILFPTQLWELLYTFLI
jgi:hypothetical protein